MNKWDIIALIFKESQDHEDFGRYLDVFYRYETPSNRTPDVERESTKQENKVIVGKDKFVIDDIVNNSKIEIDIHDANDVLNKLKNLDEEQVDALTQIKEKRKLNDMFEAILEGVAMQKNIVRGNISNVQEVKIGDEIHYQFHYYRIIKKNTSISIQNIVNL